VLSGAKGPQRDIVLVNSAAALVARGKARDFLGGMTLAAAAIDTGSAQAKLTALAEWQRG